MCTATEKTDTVEGMTCGQSVRKEVEALAGVQSVHADRGIRSLTVRGTGIDDNAVRRAVQAAGYNVTPANTPANGSDEDLEVSG